MFHPQIEVLIGPEPGDIQFLVDLSRSTSWGSMWRSGLHLNVIRRLRLLSYVRTAAFLDTSMHPVDPLGFADLACLPFVEVLETANLPDPKRVVAKMAIGWSKMTGASQNVYHIYIDIILRIHSFNSI